MNDPVMEQIQKSLDGMYALGYQDGLRDAKAAMDRLASLYAAAGKPAPATPVEAE